MIKTLSNDEQNVPQVNHVLKVNFYFSVIENCDENKVRIH